MKPFSNLELSSFCGQIALILKAHKLTAAQGGKVWIEHPSRQALRVMETSGIERIVPIAQETGKE